MPATTDTTTDAATNSLPPYRDRRLVAARVAAATLALAGLGITSSRATPQTGTFTRAASVGVTAKAVAAPANKGPEISPAGDIPDNQVFVPFTPKSGGYAVSVPEGWARTENKATTSFTDKLNTIAMIATKAATPPTIASLATTELAAIRIREPRVTRAKTSQVTRKAGPVVVLKYQRNSTANSVTGKVVREAVERYEFWRNGTQVTLTLSGPLGADNVDPWRIVTDSFTWK